MADVVERSPEMVRLAYFLHEYARIATNGRTLPPSEFGDLTLADVYERFYPRLGAGRSLKTFKGSAEGLRKGNIKEHKENGVVFLPKYEVILRTWILRSREEQWAELKEYFTV